MCNLYSVTKGQAAIIALTRALRDTTGNLPSMPGVFPDYMAPVVRNSGIRELTMLRWGMPGPPQFLALVEPRHVERPGQVFVGYTRRCDVADDRGTADPR